MHDLWQIVITDTNGLVSGVTFFNPIDAVRIFSKYIRAPRVGEVIFRKIGESNITIGDPAITFAEILEHSTGTEIYFLAGADASKEINRLESFVQMTDKDGAFLYRKIVVIDVTTATVMIELTPPADQSNRTTYAVSDSKFVN